MPTIHLIAAVASNGVIGAAQEMPWHIPEDLRHFKQLTTGHTVIMGRRTYESIGHGLPDRQNIVLSQTMTQCVDAQLAVSLEQALALADWPEIYIIGGGQIYAQALPLAQQLDLTWVDLTPHGDVFFPEVDWSQFEEISRKPCRTAACQFVTYRRKSAL